MISQKEIQLPAFARGFHIITDHIHQALDPLPNTGLLHLFIKHTSAGLTINENADPTVLDDFERIFNHIVPENLPFIQHTMEGPDDMPAHVKSAMVGSSVSLPITDGRFNLGTWQGIYLCEFRTRSRQRKLVATIIGT